jgi:transposase-like protein
MERNGRRPKTLATRDDEIEIGIPKLRKGSFLTGGI